MRWFLKLMGVTVAVVVVHGQARRVAANRGSHAVRAGARQRD